MSLRILNEFSFTYNLSIYLIKTRSSITWDETSPDKKWLLKFALDDATTYLPVIKTLCYETNQASRGAPG